MYNGIVCCDIGVRQLISENVDMVEKSSSSCSDGKRRKLSPVRQLHTKALSDFTSDMLTCTSTLIGGSDSSVHRTETVPLRLEARSVDGTLWRC